jgi:hypothetical protein
VEGRDKISKYYLFKTGLHQISNVDTFQILQDIAGNSATTKLASKQNVKKVSAIWVFGRFL